MIVSANSTPHAKEFNSLLNSTISTLNTDAKTSAKKLLTLAGNKLEPHIAEIMKDKAKGTPFENTIELVSGQKFPDIVAKKYYGVEVKSTTQNHWKTTGNSVLESTRVEGVERIFMLFGKLAEPVEFKCRPYEECLSEVVVTHSPRYLVDMDLKAGATIFDKIGTTYDKLRNEPNPINPIVKYYKSTLKEGEELWWIDPSVNKSSSLVIKIWNNLSSSEKQLLRNKAFVYFPELFSNRSDKFSRLATWLVTRESVVCPNVRDLFTAGGKENITINKKTYKNVPRIFITLVKHIKSISENLQLASPIELESYWGVKTNEKNKFDTWLNLVTNQAKKISDAKHINIKELISNSLLK